jgi:hypothetical protein
MRKAGESQSTGSKGIYTAATERFQIGESFSGTTGKLRHLISRCHVVCSEGKKRQLRKFEYFELRMRETNETERKFE